MYAYCRESKGRVLEVREKACFTDNRENEYASSGSYYFRSRKLTKDYFRKAKDSGVTVNGEFYVSLVYNPMIADGLDVRVYEIPFFLQWGTPQDLEDYQYWHRLFHRMARETVPSKPDSTPLLMPMAGGGERFRKAGYPSKPLCPVMGKPMFLAAVEHLPCDSSRPVLVTQPDVAEEVRRAHPGAELVVLDGPTQGQADTCRKALGKLDLEKPVLISSCDHGLVWDREKWNGIVSSGADVVIVGQRGVPDVRRKPASYAYLRLGPDGVRIAEVSVKKPISPQPQRDPILVGTFYFRKARFMADAVQKLIERDVRVNGELYLDSAVNLCIEAGLDVRCFEADGYLCWGSPEALREFNYWYRYFLGVSS
jgi:bifunctional N-acetylglucosamine-1-phosphate-uridyltransferase/glucosamine-1-phosphate-acetyltransferase GlmU-like protein